MRRKPPKGNVDFIAVKGINRRGLTVNKSFETVQYGSLFEQYLTLKFRRDLSIVNFASRPEAFTYVNQQGKEQTFVPAFIVWRVDKQTEIHHVIHQEQAADLVDAAVHQQCRDRGWKCVIHKARMLKYDSELANLRALSMFHPQIYTDPEITYSALSYLKGMQQMLITELMFRIAETTNRLVPHVSAALCHLLWHDRICTHWHNLMIIDGEFAPKMVVWLNEGKE